MLKKYTTFDQIDLDLKRLKLQSEINKEELKLSFLKTKESVTPSKLVSGLFGGIASSGFLYKVLTPIASIAIGKLMAKKEKN